MNDYENSMAYLDKESLVDLVVHLSCGLQKEKEMRGKLEEELDGWEAEFGKMEKANSRPVISTAEAAKELGLTRKKFEKWLVKEGFARRDGVGTVVPCSDDTFTPLMGLKDSEDGPVMATYVRPYGMEAFKLMLDKQRRSKKKKG